MNLLFITATRVGDAVLTCGLLDHLLERHPGARVTIACGAPAASLFAAVPGLERIHVVRKRRYNLHWLDLWTRLLDRRWDLVVDLRSSLIGLLVRRRARLTHWKQQHRSHRVVELGRLAGIEPPPMPRAWTTEAQEATAGRLLGSGPILAVGPAANSPGKQWPAARFAGLAKRLTGPEGFLPGARIAIFAADNERAQVEPLLASLDPDRTIDLVGQLDLLEVAACLKRASLYVGNDSGLMHLAAACRTPTLGLFGPSPVERYRPWGPHCAVAQTLESYEALQALPDYRERWRQGRLMDSLTVDRAATAAEELWARLDGGREALSAEG